MSRSRGPGTRPELAVLLLGLGATALVAGALVFGGMRTSDYHDRLVEVNARSVQPLDLLNRAEAEFHQSQVGLGKGLAASGSQAAAALLADSLSHSTEAERIWRKFESQPARFDAESLARQVVDQAIASNSSTGQDLGVLALSPNPDPVRIADLTVKQRAAYLALQTDLGALSTTGYEPAVSADLARLQLEANETATSLRLGLGLVLVVGMTITLVAYRRSARAERTLRRERGEQEMISQENALDATLQHAFDMADDEVQVFSFIERALAVADDRRPAQLLIAEVESGLFDSAVSGDPAEGRSCSVSSPEHCPAARHGQRLTFTSSEDLDACWHLGQHHAAPLSAACVPVTIAGQSVGVIHECRPDGQPPTDHRVRELEIVARKAGERLGTLRSFARSERRARTDPLTGLLNRRSLEEEVATLDHQGVDYAVAFADLDHFKDLNDTFGHEAGDEALRMFCGVLGANVRPGDVVSRYGGEEFVVLLPRCSAEDAVPVLQRVQNALGEALRAAGGPPFTVSIGIAATCHADTFDETLAAADASLLDAKHRGRNRIIVTDRADTTGGPAPSERPRPISSIVPPPPVAALSGSAHSPTPAVTE